MTQRNFTSNFNGSDQGDAHLVIHGHDGTEYEYSPSGTDVNVPADSYVIDTTITFAEFHDDVQPLRVPVILLVPTLQGNRVYTFCGDDTTSFHFVCIQDGTLYWQKLSSGGWTSGNYSMGTIGMAEAPLKIVGNKITNNGYALTVTGTRAWAEGDSTKATGDCSHAEGSTTQATSSCCHAEGTNTKATSMYSHSEGSMTEASGVASHAEGVNTKATGTYAHAEGMDTVAGGTASHTEGEGTRTTKTGGSACGRFNDAQDAIFVVGDGIDENNRKDVFKVDANGDTWIMINGVLTNISSMLVQ